MAQVFVITSGKGGVGKTTTTANIGAGLAAKGYKTVMLDTDIGLRNLDVVLGLENRIVFDIVDVAEERCKLRQALIKDKRFPSLFLMPASQTKEKSAITQQQMIKIVDQLRHDHDYIIIDCPAGIEQGFKNAIAAADRAIIVTVPEVSALRDADRIIGLLAANDITDMKLIINRLRADMVKSGGMLNIDDTLDILGIDLLGVVPEDDNILKSSNTGEPIVTLDKTPAGKAFGNIVSRIMGEDVPICAIEEESRLMQRLRKLFNGKQLRRA